MRTLIAVAVACLTLTGLTVASETQAAVRKFTDIPAQQLGSALVTLERDRNLEVIFVAEDVRDVRTRGATGELTCEEILKQLLTETGLTYRFMDEKTITILPAQPLATSAGNSVPSVVGATQGENPRSVTQEGEATPKRFWQRLKLAQSDSTSRKNDEPSDQKDEPRYEALEEIVVTAQKRQQSAQLVPISMATLSGEDIAKVVANTLSDLQFAVPGVQIGTTSMGGFTIRGVSGFTRNIGSEGRAGVYVDEVYVGRSAGVDQNLFDVERVEILKGPQGTLFGRNTVSGAVNITTRKPQPQVEGSVTLEAGNLNRTNGTLIVNAPLIDERLFARLSANAIQQDGYTDNLTTAEQVGGFDKSSGRLQLRYLASDALELNLSVDKRESRKDIVGFQLFTDIDALGPRAIRHDAREFDDNNLLGAALTVDYALPGDFKLKSISAYQEEDFAILTDEDAMALDFATSFFQEDNQQFTQELRLESPDLGGYDFLVGLYYLDQTLTSNRHADLGTAFTPTGASVQAPGEVDLESFAAYAHTNFYLTPRLTLTAGLRYTSDTKSVDYNIADSTGLFIDGTVVDEERWDDWSPKLGLQFQFNPDVMLYASVSRAFKAGGYNLDFLSSLEQVRYDPETATSYEIGIKSELFARRVRLNVAAYAMKFDDYQVFQFRQLPSGGTILVLTNAAEATSEGAEVELLVKPLQDLTLTANYAYIDAKYDRFPNGGGLGIDYDGTPIGSTPKHTFYVAADYQLAAGRAGSLNTHVDYARADAFDKFINLSLSEPIRAQKTLNARIELLTSGERLSFAVWGRNLTDEETPTDVVYNFLGARYALYALPRTWGATVKYNF